jgi:hypothetical protein
MTEEAAKADLRVVSTFYRVARLSLQAQTVEDSRRRSRMDRRRYGVEGWILIYILPASGRWSLRSQGD